MSGPSFLTVLIAFLLFPIVITIAVVAIVALVRRKNKSARGFDVIDGEPTPEQAGPEDAEGRGGGPRGSVP